MRQLGAMLGGTQRELLLAAYAKPSGQLMLDPKRQNREWCSMKRMVRRGLFERYEFGFGSCHGSSVTVVYQISAAGRALAGAICGSPQSS